MKSNRIAFTVISLVTLLAFAPLAFKIQLVAAQTDASSSTTTSDLPPSTTTATDTAGTTDTTTPSTPAVDQASTSAPTATTATAPAPPLPAPVQATSVSLTLVHMAGTKYVDYCTDGSKVTAYPGDAAIDAHFDVPNAPTPKCPGGQTWDHTSGTYAYDTQSGDLGVNQYAQLSDGSYVVHYPAQTYKDATSTAQLPDRITTTGTDPSTIQPPEGVTLTPAQ
jgi:hypothetical protein